MLGKDADCKDVKDELVLNMDGTQYTVGSTDDIKEETPTPYRFSDMHNLTSFLTIRIQNLLIPHNIEDFHARCKKHSIIDAACSFSSTYSFDRAMWLSTRKLVECCFHHGSISDESS